jgi:PTH1 family peptidyl-tRNA hydrolase
LDVVADRLGISFRKPFLKAYALARAGLGSGELVLAKPLTYMNRCGQVLPEILARAGIGPEGLVVVCDTLDLPPGQCRLRRKGSSAGHKGLASIISTLGREDFMRLYVGIGHPGSASQVVDYVLGRPTEEESKRIAGALGRAADALLSLLDHDPEKVMNGLNQKTEGA